MAGDMNKLTSALHITLLGLFGLFILVHFLVCF